MRSFKIPRIRDQSLARKLVFSVTLFFVPITLLGYFFIAQKEEMIDFSRQEVVGLRYLQAAHEALVVSALPFANQDQITAARGGLDAAETADLGAMGATDLTQALVKKLDMAVANGKMPSSAITKANQLVSSLSDKSHLTFDSDPDVFYLGDALINQTTNILVKTNEAISTERDLSRNSQSADFIQAYNVARDHVATMQDGFSQSLRKAIAANKDGSLQTAFQSDPGLIGDSIDKLMIALNAKDFQAIEHNATSLVTAIENFDARGDKHIKRLIENRIDGFYRDLLTQLCVASFAILVGSTLAFFIVRSITSSLRHITQLMGRLTKGELSVDIPQEERRDEIGSLTLALKAFHEAAVERHDARNREMTRIELERLRAAHLQKLNAAFNDSVSQSLSHLNVAVTQLNSVSQAMAQGAERASRQASEVVSAAEETSQNVQTVASASEQMSASIHAIAAQIQESGSMAQQAEQEAKQTRVAVNALSEVTTKISDVVILINQIAGQTNLLALNATIEAARAGEAGKGFAVVASEVKSLANQTARATDEIGEHIAAVQASVHNVSGAIEHIDATIMQMNKIAGTISLAVQQQNEATAEISRSVQHAASSTTEVTGNISSISEVIAESGRTAQDVLEAAKELETQTSKLKIDVSTYLTDVQTA